MRLNALPIANRMGKLDGDVDDRLGFGVEDSIRCNGSSIPYAKYPFTT
jgi:hypothetical protein